MATQRSYVNKQLALVKELFNVPNLIGTVDANGQKQGLTKAKHASFRAFVESVDKESTETTSNIKTLKEQFVQLNTKLIDTNKELRTKISDIEYEKDQ